MQVAEKSSTVRQHWSEFMDDVFHKVPKFVQRNDRDVFMAMNLDYLSVMLSDTRYSIEIEEDKEAGEFVATMDGFWFVESGQTEKEALHNLAAQLLDYSLDYFKEINMHINAPNLKPQLPRVTKALIVDDIEGIIKFFDVEYV
jgi:Antitoxin of toxin-antitoxin, RelE / RelB, TA system